MDNTTTFQEPARTITFDNQEPSPGCEKLIEQYGSIVSNQRFIWTTHHRWIKRLGEGGQGIVFLSERRGADSFTIPVALKLFSPEPYPDVRSYHQAMARIAHVAAHVAQIQQDNLLDVHNFIDRNRIRLMEMEWIDGYDLSRMLTSEMLDRVRDRASARRWDQVNDILVTAGPVQPRLKAGVAIAIVRECLAALAALHRAGIIHGDVKPGNIMLKRTGNAKIIDIGSAFEMNDPPPHRSCTPAYAAPEVLEKEPSCPQSDLASLGYVLIEMLSGRPAFVGMKSYAQLLEAKRFMAQRLPSILPREVTVNPLLMNFCKRLIAPDPSKRFQSAEEADMHPEQGASRFHRQLIQGNLASEYNNDIRLWLEGLD